MELKDLIKLLNKHFKTALVCALVIGVVSFVCASLIKPRYKASTTLFVTRSVEKSSSYFTYEGFYSIQTAEKFTDTVVGLLKSVDVKRLALESVGLSFDPKSLARLEKGLLVKKASGQLVTVSITDKSESYAKNLLLELSKETVRSAQEINRNGDTNISVSFVSGGGGEESVIVVKKDLNAYVVGAGFFALSFFGVLFLFAFRSLAD